MASAASRSGVWLVFLLWIAFALNYVDRQMVYSIVPALKADLRFTDVQLGLTGSVFAWVYSLSMPVAGRLSDTMRRDRMIVASLLLWSAATLGCGLSASVLAFLIWRAVMGVTESLYYPAALGALAEAHSGATRSRAMGIHQSAQLAGIVAGGSYGGWMADHAGWRAGFLIAAAAGMIYSLVLLKKLPPSQAPRCPKATGSWTGALHLFRGRCYLAISAAFFAFCSMLWIFYAWLPSFLYERHHLSMAESGFQATVFVQTSCGIGVLLGSALADRLSKSVPAARLYITAAGVLLCAPFGYFTFALHSLTWAIICSAGYGGFSGLAVANVFAAAYDIIAPARFGLGAGILNMTGGIAATVMIYLAGLLKSTIGFAGLLSWVAAGCVATSLILAWAAASSFGEESARRLTA
ncbi:MAG: MFS transporter [Bryobacterales bacterium]|nr:MFS transporter [Bryobacterales bacterium]